MSDVSRSQLIEVLQAGLDQLSLTLPKNIQTKMIEFIYLLQKWNQKINLTAIDGLSQMVIYHLLDSLTVAPYLQGERILDVGTGAGLPGIPLALSFPKKQFVLLEKNHKKVSFLIQVKSMLPLDNVEIVASRVENYHTEKCFDAIIFRAVGKIKALIEQSTHLCCDDGKFLLMKGAYPEKELQAIESPSKVISLKVPGMQAKRHLIIIKAGSRSNS